MTMEGTTTSGAFTGATLAEKLNKLNSSQQSIETLSHWCIFHRKKAREVVETWAKKFQDAPKEQRVPFLYLANDILQNSRRKGPEFVNEFWTVLPRVLRDIVVSGDESVRSPAYRLVDIWEERRVFGSRAQSLREELLGKKASTRVQEAKQPSLPLYQVFEGSILETVARSYQAIQEKSGDEYDAISKCTAAMSQIESLEKEAEGATGDGNVQASIAGEVLEQQAIMRQCVERLGECEMSHVVLCAHLKDALVEQESKLEELRRQLQRAQTQLDKAGMVQNRFATGTINSASAIDFSDENASFSAFSREAGNLSHENQVARNNDNELHMSMPSVPMPSIEATVSTLPSEPSENNHGLTSAATVAAEVAAKLAASSSSAAMLTSVLSSLAAEEANGGVHSPNFSMDGGRALEKRPRLESRPDLIVGTDSSTYQLPPPMQQTWGGSMLPLPYAYQSSLPPPPPMQGQRMMNQHSMPLPPQPMAPGCAPAYVPFQQSSIFYSPPPLPAPPAPAPRQ